MSQLSDRGNIGVCGELKGDTLRCHFPSAVTFLSYIRGVDL